MTLRILKQVLNLTGEQIIHVPHNAQFINVAQQDRSLTIWYMCNSDNEYEERKIIVRGTGLEFEGSDATMFDLLSGYIGTVVMTDGFVWHVFEAE